jgi:virginiamycin B lyase
MFPSALRSTRSSGSYMLTAVSSVALIALPAVKLALSRRETLLAALVTILIRCLTATQICSAEDDTSRHSPSTNAAVVLLYDEAPYFSPKRLRIPVGTTVTWVNKGPALVHSVVVSTESGETRSEPIRPGAQWEHTFDGPGIVKTGCSIHPYMYGIVLVGDIPETALPPAMSENPQSSSMAPSAQFREFSLPVLNAVPGIIEVDKDDYIWFTMGGGGWANITYPPLNLVGRITVDGDFRQYSLPTKDSGPNGIVVSPKGILYISELMAGKIATLDPKRKVIEEISIPVASAWPTAMSCDGTGNLWVSITRANMIACLSPEGMIWKVPVPTAGAHPTGLQVDDAGNVWFAERDAGKIGCLRVDRSFVEYALPSPKAKPSGIVVDSHNRVWLAERDGNALAVLENGAIREYPLPHPNSGPFFLRLAQDAHIWLSETYGNRIAVFDTKTNTFVEYDIPTRDSWPGGIAFDREGNVWFTEQLGNKVGVLLMKPATQQANNE